MIDLIHIIRIILGIIVWWRFIRKFVTYNQNINCAKISAATLNVESVLQVYKKSVKDRNFN